MNSRNKATELFLGVVFIYVICTVVYTIVVHQNIPCWEKSGQFGDTFGAFNAFFTGLAFIGVVLTLWKQHYTQVETSFFSMLTLLQDIINSTSFEELNVIGDPLKYSGRAYFKFAFEDFTNRYMADVIINNRNIFPQGYVKTQEQRNKVSTITEETSKAPLIKSYEDMYDIHDYNLGHYYRYIYNIIKYIKESFPDNPDNQNKYIGILQAQLSNDEMGLIFYNAISKHGKNSEGNDLFRQWLDEHNFFQNIDRRCVFHPSFVKYYPKTKFKFLQQI